MNRKCQRDAEHKRRWLMGLFLVAALYGASSTAIAADAPLPFVLDVTGDDPALRAALTAALAEELHRPVVPAIEAESGAAEALTIVVKGNQAKLLYKPSHEIRERSTALPDVREDRVRRLVWLAGNLCREQVPLVSRLSEDSERDTVSETDNVPDPQGAGPEPVQAPAIAPPVTEPPDLELRATAAPIERTEPKEWVVRLSAGPSMLPYRLYRYKTLDYLQGRTNIQLDLEYKPQASGNWMVTLSRGGSEMFLAGAALSRMWGWQLGRTQLKLSAGAGVALAMLVTETFESTSMRTERFQQGMDAFATAGALWNFPLWRLPMAHVKASAVATNADWRRGSFISLTTGFAFDL